MAILVLALALSFSGGLWASEKGPKEKVLLTAEFDWQGWERLSWEEKERNILWINKTHPDHCDPLKEYREALDFFRNRKEEVNPSEARSRSLAGIIAQGCKGAATRFIKVFLLLKKSGVDHPRAIEYALRFANSDDETVENFFEVFKKTYLGEFFDLDYSTALKLSFDLSLLYKGNRQKAREDFWEIARFCLNKEGLNLPVTQCAELAVAMSRLSQYYPNGIRGDFFKLYKTLREDRRFGVSMLTALRIINEVLPYGPTAPATFLRSFEFAIDPQGLASGGVAAIKFAVLMAKKSLKSWPPPIYTPPSFIPVNPEIHVGYGLGGEYQSDTDADKGRESSPGKVSSENSSGGRSEAE